MKIRTRITLLFTIITATILLVFAAVVYFSAKESRENEFYAVLKKEAVTKANLFFNAEVATETLQEIYRSNRMVLNEVEVAIYDSSFHLLYHDAVDIDMVKETREMIDQIYEKGEMRFYQANWQVIGIKYQYRSGSYIITATAVDQYGYNKLENLLKTIIAGFIISILILYIAGRFFSKKAFEPVKEMTEKAKRISATNLDLRLGAHQSKDELNELANTFNEMLDRLEKSFDAQKHFVSNISHEIRTPLAAIITELELSANKNLTIEEFKITVQNALGDAKKLVRLSNSLLDFAKASYDTAEISFKPVRIDEVLLDAMQQVQQLNTSCKVDIRFENDFEAEDEVLLQGNEYLLKTAFVNLFENGCKFSNNPQSTAIISVRDGEIKIEFADRGIGIPEDDLKHIFTTFYRGDNRKFAEGNGIGLALTQKIIQLHKGTISVTSDVAKGTTFTVVFASY